MENSNPGERIYKVPAEGLPLSELMNDGVTFDVDYKRPGQLEQLTQSSEDVDMEASFSIEHAYQGQVPFNTVAILMTDIIKGGKVKKRILQDGYGDLIPKTATVTIDYAAFLQYDSKPFDSTYASATPLVFKLGSGTTILGFDLAVQSMKMKEKAQFLVHSDYACGKQGCIERIPPDSDILFEIEVKDIVNPGASNTFPNSSEYQEATLEEINEYANISCMKAKEMCKAGEWKSAVAEYSYTASKLENCWSDHDSDMEKRNQILLHLYTNLAVIYVKLERPREGSLICTKAINMCKGKLLQPSAKLFFNYARCFTQLGDYDQAEKQLKHATSLEPLNSEISRELKKVEGLKKDYFAYEKKFAKAMFGSTGLERKMGN